jgi:hypothetical protein
MTPTGNSNKKMVVRYIPTPAMVFFLKPDDKIMGLWGFAVNSQTNPAKLIQPLAPHVLTKRFAAMPWR